MFQSTHPHGVRRVVVRVGIELTQVSIHAPAWGATRGVRLPLLRYGVSIHAPAWGATVVGRTFGHCCRFQSTHPHGVRRNPAFNYQFQNTVSIHAPAWGATSMPPKRTTLSEFQSTHPHGVRRFVSGGMRSIPLRFNPRTRMGCDKTFVPKAYEVPCFNPRTRMGCDVHKWVKRRNDVVSIHAPAWGATDVYKSPNLFFNVSIHAPAWGATTYCLASLGYNSVSIHAPAWGATLPRLTTPNVSLFQSTHPHGVRLRQFRHGAQFVGFNPRTRMGCDLFACRSG